MTAGSMTVGSTTMEWEPDVAAEIEVPTVRHRFGGAWKIVFAHVTADQRAA